MEGDIRSRQDVACDQGAVDGHTTRDVAEQATGPRRLGKCPEVRMRGRPVGLSEVALDEIRVLAYGRAEVGENDALLGSPRRKVRLELR